MNLTSVADKIFYFILYPNSIPYFIYLEIIAFIVIIFFSVFIIIFLIKTSWLRARLLEKVVEFITYKPFGSKKALKKWEKIIKKLESGEESEYKLAIIEADDFLTEALEKENYKGETLEKKIKQLEPLILSNAKDVIQAHEMRNKIVYNPNYKLDLEEAKKAVDAYKKALEDLDLF